MTMTEVQTGMKVEIVMLISKLLTKQLTKTPFIKYKEILFCEKLFDQNFMHINLDLKTEIQIFYVFEHQILIGVVKLIF